MKFYYYLYYRLIQFYKRRSPDIYKAEALSTFYGIILINLASMYFIAWGIIRFTDPIANFDTGNPFTNRGVIFIIISLFFIPFYFFTKSKKAAFDKFQLLFENESPIEKKKNGKKVLFYLSITILLFFLGPLLALV